MMMHEHDKINIVVVTDGRQQYLDQCMATIGNLAGPIANRFMFDDSGDDTYRARLARQYKNWMVIGKGPRLGFTTTMINVWQVMALQPQQWFFHVEGDFTFPSRVDLAAMQTIMIENPYLAQIALLRQPWNPEERAAGGYIALDPNSFVACKDNNGNAWLKHRKFFTTNPHLTRRTVCSTGWEDRDQSEGHTSLRLFRQGFPGVSGENTWSAILGSHDDRPRCLHIGNYREGHGY